MGLLQVKSILYSIYYKAVYRWSVWNPRRPFHEKVIKEEIEQQIEQDLVRCGCYSLALLVPASQVKGPCTFQKCIPRNLKYKLANIQFPQGFWTLKHMRMAWILLYIQTILNTLIVACICILCIIMHLLYSDLICFIQMIVYFKQEYYFYRPI